MQRANEASIQHNPLSGGALSLHQELQQGQRPRREHQLRRLPGLLLPGWLPGALQPPT